jgi:hypothetical protein
MLDLRLLHESPHLEPVIKEYESALRIVLHLHRPSRARSKPRDDPGLHVHLFALPSRFPLMAFMGENRMWILPMAFGLTLREGARQALILPDRMKKGVVLRDDEGNELAYLHQRNIFVLFDVIGQAKDLAPLLLRCLLDRSLAMMMADLAAQSGLHPERLQLILAGQRRTTELQASGWHQTRRASVIGRFKEGRGERIADEMGFLESEIRSTEETLETASRRITAETRHLQACRRRLGQLRGELDEGEADLARELDRLSEHREVAEVTTLPAGLRIITRRLHVEHRGRQYVLGRFQVDLLYNGEITIHNLTNKHGYYDHPHIWNGTPCLGNVREGLAKLIGEFQLAAAAEVIVDFLKTINHKDWHISIEHWGTIPDEGRPASLPPGAPKLVR